MKVPAQLVASNEVYAVLAIEPGRDRELVLTLDRALTLKNREAVLSLRQGANREPVRLVGLPESEPRAGATDLLTRRTRKRPRQ